ncbi:MAG: tetratricopeptide repeat protein [Chloroflexi bacterium]|nr:MAG: tetratricopeptide repeat protein [Chloroflexota bacterium]
MLVDVASQQRDREALEKYAPLAEQQASHYDHVLYQAIAHRAWGVLNRLKGQYDEASIRFQQALSLFQKLETRWQIGRTYFELGELAIESADTPAARVYYSEAQKAFEEMKALPAANRMQEILEKLG